MQIVKFNLILLQIYYTFLKGATKLLKNMYMVHN